MADLTTSSAVDTFMQATSQAAMRTAIGVVGGTISATGDISWASGVFDATGNVTAAATLATVNPNVGTFALATVTANAKGLITAISATTTPNITQILDTNSNEVAIFGSTASAVNEITITNNATGSAPIIAATGGDTNIGLSIKQKGTGTIKLGVSSNPVQSVNRGNVDTVEVFAGGSQGCAMGYGFGAIGKDGFICGSLAGVHWASATPLSGGTYYGGISALAANVLGVSSASFHIGTVGYGLGVKEGTNATMGVATLVGGTLVVSTTKVTANSRIFLMCNTPGGTPGWLQVSARSAGTSFTILSSSGTDTSDVAWIIIEPAA